MTGRCARQSGPKHAGHVGVGAVDPEEPGHQGPGDALHARFCSSSAGSRNLQELLQDGRAPHGDREASSAGTARGRGVRGLEDAAVQLQEVRVLAATLQEVALQRDAAVRLSSGELLPLVT